MDNGSGLTKAITHDFDNKTNFDRKMFFRLSVPLIFRAFLVSFSVSTLRNAENQYHSLYIKQMFF